MMTHEMFSRLGIPATDDIRAIKRAYATALKSIDQQTQQAEFEALRRAYEAALERASRPAPQALAENGGLQPEPAAPPDALPAAAPSAHRAAALDHWGAMLFHATPGQASGILDQALNDPNLDSLDGRTDVMQLGMAVLRHHPAERAEIFEALAQRFQWHLAGQPIPWDPAASAWIERVLVQEAAWATQPIAQRKPQKQALDAARSRATPSRHAALRHYPTLATLHEHFPDWLLLRVDATSLQAWQKRFAGIPAYWHRGWHAAQWGVKYKWGVLGVCLFAVSLAINNDTPAPSPTKRSELATPRILSKTSTPEWEVEITGVPPIYPLEAKRQRIVGRTLIGIQIDSDGRLAWAKIDQTSGSELLDHAALAAAIQIKPRVYRGQLPVRTRIPIEFSLSSPTKHD